VKNRLTAARVELELVTPTGARIDVAFVHTFAQCEDAAVYMAREVRTRLFRSLAPHPRFADDVRIPVRTSPPPPLATTTAAATAVSYRNVQGGLLGRACVWRPRTG